MNNFSVSENNQKNVHFDIEKNTAVLHLYDEVLDDKLASNSYLFRIPAICDHCPYQVRYFKRTLDLFLSLSLMVFCFPLCLAVALAIKVDSSGPVFYRQLRVGRILPDRTELFTMIKFRSMRADAELSTGAVWSANGDNRITKVGSFLRKTRLDELPQLINVICGDMSLIGPRPERPIFYGRLSKSIPLFVNRTAGLRPGITGFSQVRQGYDTDIDDVRRKVAFDAAYAVQLASMSTWIRADLDIIYRTLIIMVRGLGR